MPAKPEPTMFDGAIVRRHRVAAGLSRRELAAKVELRPDSLRKLECNAVQPSVTLLCRLADVFGVSVAAFFPSGEPDLRNDHRPSTMGAIADEAERASLARAPETLTPESAAIISAALL